MTMHGVRGSGWVSGLRGPRVPRAVSVRAWLQAGAAAAGLGAALLAIPAPASAETRSGPADTASAGSSSAAPAQRAAGRSTRAPAAGLRVAPAQNRSGTPARRTAPSVAAESPADVEIPVVAPAVAAQVVGTAPGPSELNPNPPVPDAPVADLVATAWAGLRRVQAAPAAPVPTAAPAAPAPAVTAAAPPSITVHNDAETTMWVYNLTTSGDYSIPADFQPLSIAAGHSAPVTLALGTGAPGTPENRIYIVEGEQGFALPVASPGGIDAFDPTAVTAGNSFLNYSFVEYFYYPSATGDQYTIDVSYIDEWSLPIQFEFTVNGADWTGAVSGKTYGFNDFDTVASQLTAAGGPYGDLIWSGDTPWTPQPPASVSRIIGPDKVWAQQSSEPAANVNMNMTGWVPASYQNFVQYGYSAAQPSYPYAQDGTQYSPKGNFTFWKDAVSAPGSTPYPIALRTAAMLDGFPADANGVYGFFTYPNDETAGQFTNIPTAVALDIHVHGSSDGSSGSVIEGGQWLQSGTLSPAGTPWRIARKQRPVLAGTAATDTFILDRTFSTPRTAPRLVAGADDLDVVVIDRMLLAGAISSEVDIVERARFGGGGHANDASQFVYETSTGYLYYDRDPSRRGYTGILANLSGSSIDPAQRVFVL